VSYNGLALRGLSCPLEEALYALHERVEFEFEFELSPPNEPSRHQLSVAVAETSTAWQRQHGVQ
jgi:hypothetical protein